MATDTLSAKDKEFLEKCEEEFKSRYTENDEEFMKVFNAEPSKPPIVENWWVSQNYGRRNDRRHNRRFHPYDRSGNRHRGNQDRGYHSYHDHGYNDRRNQQRDRRGYNDY